MVCVVFKGFDLGYNQGYITNAAIDFGSALQFGNLYTIQDLQDCLSILKEFGYTILLPPHALPEEGFIIYAYALK